jgi:hypothetical protein
MTKNDFFKADIQKICDGLNRVRFAVKLQNSPQNALNNPGSLMKLNGRGEFEPNQQTIINNAGIIPNDYSPVL